MRLIKSRVRINRKPTFKVESKSLKLKLLKKSKRQLNSKRNKSKFSLATKITKKRNPLSQKSLRPILYTKRRNKRMKMSKRNIRVLRSLRHQLSKTK